MRILLVTQVVPNPPDSGPKVKTHNVLRYLAKRHEVHLVSFVRSESEASRAEDLRTYCSSVTTVPLQRSRPRDAVSLVKSLFTGRPFLIERDNVGPMRRAIDRLTKLHDFDAFHADQLSMAQFVVAATAGLRVLDEHNAVWTIVRRAAGRERFLPVRLLAELEWRKLRAYEGQVCREFDVVTAVSESDLADLQAAARCTFPARIIPIAVDTEDLSFSKRAAEAVNVVSVATMFYPPNVEGVHWFATDVFPLVRRKLPGVSFQIVGSRPPPRITNLATESSGIDVTGYIADLSPILHRSGVVVVPVQSGSGMRVKILEAFARGIPVVSTAIGVEGIDAIAGEHLLVADDAQDFADAVIQVLQNPSLADRLARSARALVESRYDWQTALRGLDAIYPTDATFRERLDPDQLVSQSASQSPPGS